MAWNSFFLDRGVTGFDWTVDFDENKTINILDFGLLRGKFLRRGTSRLPLWCSAPD